ncbi:hypothetical protein DFH11DRAFT_1723846 [Phellopilus nigrolimitatus]|nr:hypothetical protein DFH11DRAFT_1723846 [Phellopilus nigrolimitatus]
MPPKIKKEISIHQTFLDDRHPPIALLTINECKLNRSHINWVLQPATSATSVSTPETKVIGMHPAFTEAGLLSALAISVSSKVLLITDVMKLRAAGQRGTRSGNSTTDGRDYLQSTVLNDSAYLITAFDAHQLVLGLHSAMGLTCTRVVDLLSLRPGDRDVVRTVQLALGARVELLGNLLLEAFQDNVYRDKEQQAIVAQKAWLAGLIGDHPNARAKIARISPIDSSAFSKQELDILAQGMQALNILDSAKPASRIIEHVDASLKGNKVILNQTHFGDRLKESQNQGQDGVILSADLSHVDGRMAKLKVPELDGLLNTHVKSIMVSGKAGPTLAEVKQAHTILLVLQRQVPLLSNPWFNRLFPSAATERQCHPPNTDLATALNPIDLSNNVDANHEWTQIEDGPCSSSAPAFDSANAPSEIKYDSQAISTNEWSKTPAGSWSSLPEDLTGSEAEVHFSSWAHIPLDDPWSTGNISHPPESDALPNSQISFKGDLNPTQTHAVQDMLDSRKDISVIQGPPGTGKTTVIAAYTASLLSDPKATLWIIAQSNVAVKNIGEKLVNADIRDWVLLVSDDFLKGW